MKDGKHQYNFDIFKVIIFSNFEYFLSRFIDHLDLSDVLNTFFQDSLITWT